MLNIDGGWAKWVLLSVDARLSCQRDSNLAAPLDSGDRREKGS